MKAVASAGKHIQARRGCALNLLIERAGRRRPEPARHGAGIELVGASACFPLGSGMQNKSRYLGPNQTVSSTTRESRRGG